MHWHEDLQFIYVLEGNITIQTLDAKVTLHEGEAVFINRDVVHLVMPDGPCHYNSFIFLNYFLKFYSESPAGILVDKIVGHPQIPVFAFKEKTPGATGFDPPFRRLSPLKTAKQNFMYMKYSCNYLPYGLKYRKISSCTLKSRPQGSPVMSIHACSAF